MSLEKRDAHYNILTISIFMWLVSKINGYIFPDGSSTISQGDFGFILISQMKTSETLLLLADDSGNTPWTNNHLSLSLCHVMGKKERRWELLTLRQAWSMRGKCWAGWPVVLRSGSFRRTSHSGFDPAVSFRISHYIPYFFPPCRDFAWSNIIATRQMWLFNFQLLKMK